MKTFMLLTWPMLFGWFLSDIDRYGGRSWVFLFVGAMLAGLLFNLAWRMWKTDRP